MASSCPSCQHLDLSFYQTNTGHVPAELDLGPLASLPSRSQCALCSLVLGLVQSKKEEFPHILSSWETEKRRRPWERMSSLVTRRQSITPQIHLILRPWEMGIEVYTVDRNANNGTNPASQLLGELTVYPIDDGSPTASAGGSTVSGTALQSILHVCETTHGEVCSGSNASNKRPETLFLIDVQNQCLVLSDSGKDVRYIALSYVWGSVDMLQATRDNIEELRKPQSLIEFRDRIPQVVLDAMAVVSLLNERFLWVDALCIVQDDPALKHLQISQMDLIYSYSTLTIVAATGAHASEGLSGVGVYRFPTAVHNQGVMITRQTDSMASSLVNSTYERRAWTLQEKLLSRRCLFFTKEQAFFRCNAGIQPENEPQVLVKLGDGATVRRANSVNPFSRFTGPSTALNDATYWHSVLQHYMYTVEDYTNRKLSFPSDVLLAFNGLATTMSLAIGGRFFSGLPECLFDQTLLWFRAPKTKLTRRTYHVNVPGEASMIAPSWSWAGWEGQIKNLVTANGYRHGHKRAIKDLNVRFGNTLTDLLRPPNPSAFDDPLKMFVRKTSTFNPPTEVLFAPLPYRTQVLLFLAATVSSSAFTFEPLPVYTPAQLDQIPYRHWILDSSLYRCGVLFDHLPFTVAPRQSPPQNLALIALSICAFTDDLNIFCWGRWTHQVPRPRMIDKTFGPLDALFEEQRPSGVCVLLVERKKDRNGVEWMERLSLGVVHRKAWDAMKPQVKTVRLA